jgi:hypothetical protein
VGEIGAVAQQKSNGVFHSLVAVTFVSSVFCLFVCLPKYPLTPTEKGRGHGTSVSSCLSRWR